MKRSMRHGRIPEEILCDPKLSSDAVRIYGIIAMWVFQGSVARRGMRKIGKEIGKSPATVYRRIKELINAGHVEAGTIENGERGFYILTSPLFGSKQRAGVKEVALGPSGTPRLVSAPRIA